MANREQVNLLLKGVRFWNNWRVENPDIEIDLRDFDISALVKEIQSIPVRRDVFGPPSSDDKLSGGLSGFNLNGADLSGSNLSALVILRANLSRANLSKANLSRSEISGTNLSGADLSGADLSHVYLRDDDLRNANLRDANLSYANLSYFNLKGLKLHGADLSHAHLTLADLSHAHLTLADLSHAKLKGADLSGTHFIEVNIESTLLDYALVDGKTLIVNCDINDSTSAYGVGLDSARIQESLKIKLKKNIRKKFWEDRYKKNWLLNIVRLFWWASDYGSSTKRIIISFGLTSLIFSFIYLIPVISTSFAQPFLADFSVEMLEDSPCSNYLGWGCSVELWFRSLYFSVVTMTTLGFGDIHAHPWSMTGQALVMLQVLLGYVLLGALITRLSILFQDVG